MSTIPKLWEKHQQESQLNLKNPENQSFGSNVLMIKQWSNI
jgi:hypothetical protein